MLEEATICKNPKLRRLRQLTEPGDLAGDISHVEVTDSLLCRPAASLMISRRYERSLLCLCNMPMHIISYIGDESRLLKPITQLS